MKRVGRPVSTTSVAQKKPRRQLPPGTTLATLSRTPLLGHTPPKTPGASLAAVPKKSGANASTAPKKSGASPAAVPHFPKSGDSLAAVPHFSKPPAATNSQPKLEGVAPEKIFVNVLKKFNSSAPPISKNTSPAKNVVASAIKTKNLAAAATNSQPKLGFFARRKAEGIEAQKQKNETTKQSILSKKEVQNAKDKNKLEIAIAKNTKKQQKENAVIQKKKNKVDNKTKKINLVIDGITGQKQKNFNSIEKQSQIKKEKIQTEENSKIAEITKNHKKKHGKKLTELGKKLENAKLESIPKPEDPTKQPGFENKGKQEKSMLQTLFIKKQAKYNANIAKQTKLETNIKKIENQKTLAISAVKHEYSTKKKKVNNSTAISKTLVNLEAQKQINSKSKKKPKPVLTRLEIENAKTKKIQNNANQLKLASDSQKTKEDIQKQLGEIDKNKVEIQKQIDSGFKIDGITKLTDIEKAELVKTQVGLDAQKAQITKIIETTINNESVIKNAKSNIDTAKSKLDATNLLMKEKYKQYQKYSINPIYSNVKIASAIRKEIFALSKDADIHSKSIDDASQKLQSAEAEQEKIKNLDIDTKLGKKQIIIPEPEHIKKMTEDNEKLDKQKQLITENINLISNKLNNTTTNRKLTPQEKEKLNQELAENLKESKNIDNIKTQSSANVKKGEQLIESIKIADDKINADNAKLAEIEKLLTEANLNRKTKQSRNNKKQNIENIIELEKQKTELETQIKTTQTEKSVAIENKSKFETEKAKHNQSIETMLLNFKPPASSTTPAPTPAQPNSSNA